MNSTYSELFKMSRGMMIMLMPFIFFILLAGTAALLSAIEKQPVVCELKSDALKVTQ
jgi:hypothetical protein